MAVMGSGFDAETICRMIYLSVGYRPCDRAKEGEGSCGRHHSSGVVTQSARSR